MKKQTPQPLRRVSAVVAALAASAIALTGCGGSSGSSGQAAPAVKDPKVLTVSATGAPISMDPGLSGNGRLGTMLQPAYEPLVRTSAGGELEPALAESWDVSVDNKAVTFTLRHDAKFSDGEAVNAAAAKKSIEYWVAKKGPFSVNLSSLESITVDSEYQFTVKLSQANPDVVSIFNTYWLAGDLISPKAVDNPAVLGTETHGAGPMSWIPSPPSRARPIPTCPTKTTTIPPRSTGTRSLSASTRTRTQRCRRSRPAS
jgi:peptide/nickel transport system substrate-binding protein